MNTTSGILRIEGELNIYRAAELKPLLLATDIQGIDLSEVEALDTAGVQLLLLAVRTAQAAGRQLQVCAASPAVQEVITLLGLDVRLGPGSAQ